MEEWQIQLILAVFFMSFNSFVVKLLVKKNNQFKIIFYQFLVALPLVFSYNLFLGNEITFNPWLILIGITYFISLSLFYKALKLSNLTKAGPIFMLNLLVSSILGIIILQERIDYKVILGLIFGVTSVFLLKGDEKK